MASPIIKQTRERIILDLSVLGISEVPMLGRYNYTHAHHGLGQHAHSDAMEICLLTKGTQLYRVGRRDYVLRGGDLFVTFPDEQHSTGEAPEEKGVLYWVIIILPRKPARFLNCPPSDARELVKRLLSIPHRHFGGTPRLQALLDEIISITCAKQYPLRRVAIGTKLVEFLLKTLECSRQHPKQKLSPRLSDLLRYMESTIEEPLTVGDMAARMALSVSRFKALFKQEIGIPPAEYLLRCKISEAKKRLTQPGATVTEIAFRLNFSSSQYFATVFKRYTGLNPRALLAQGRGTGEGKVAR